MSNCRYCKFWRADDQFKREGDELKDNTRDNTVGYCARHAPRPILANEEEADTVGLRAMWPETYASDWCGEYEQLPGFAYEFPDYYMTSRLDHWIKNGTPQ